MSALSHWKSGIRFPGRWLASCRARNWWPKNRRSTRRSGVMAEQQAIFAGGCFWCTEAVFQQIAGVGTVESGYIGGTVPDPTYDQVCGGTTGHAEAIRIGFDPDVVSYDDLLDVFFATHDPTTLNRQGNDVGTQYRSAIFPHDEGQEAAARAAIGRAQADHSAPIVTTIEPPGPWYPDRKSVVEGKRGDLGG